MRECGRFARGMAQENRLSSGARNEGSMECPENIGDPSGTRTPDSLLKRQELYHLS